MKYLAIDLGEKNIGLAISDQKGIVAAPHKIISRKSDEKAVQEITKICADEKIEALVLGLPLSAPDSTQNRYKGFGEKIAQSTSLVLNLWDETFSTKQAQNVVAFFDQLPGKKLTRSHRDDVAAAVILQEFLNNEKSS